MRKQVSFSSLSAKDLMSVNGGINWKQIVKSIVKYTIFPTTLPVVRTFKK